MRFCNFGVFGSVLNIRRMTVFFDISPSHLFQIICVLAHSRTFAMSSFDIHDHFFLPLGRIAQAQ